jgi:aerobic carbon-monoxide dehydrogenase medium subunit
MYPRSFEYARAESLDHAIELLSQHGEDARLLAGGASLIPLMKLRLASPEYIVDIGRLAALTGVRRENGAFAIGALSRHVDLERNAELLSALPIVHDAARQIGDAQVRNMGTIGGSLAECDPAGDWAPVLLALRGSVRVKGPNGERTIRAGELFVDAYTTLLQHDEIITEVVLPVPQGRFGAAHVKIERRAGDFAIANCSVALTLDESSTCQTIGVGLGGVGLVPLSVPAAEDALLGQELTEARVGKSAEALVSCTKSFDDARASEDYRRHLGGVMFRRALEAARRRASDGR